MKYALLMYQDDAAWAAADDATRAAAYKAHAEFGDRYAKVIDSGAELGPADDATTIRTRAGEPVITDGPYAETTEQLGGFYIIDAADLDEALACAKALPAGIVEIRAVIGDAEQ